MKVLILAALLAVAAASPKPRVGAMRDCGGSLATFSGTVKTDPVPVPGTLEATLTATISAVTPDDIIINKITKKVSPEQADVPCLDGISGSCVINACELIVTLPGLICPMFPPGLPCECPLPAGTFTTENVAITFDELWLSLDNPVAGDYTVRYEIYSAAAPTDILGCLDVDFSLVAA